MDLPTLSGALQCPIEAEDLTPRPVVLEDVPALVEMALRRYAPWFPDMTRSSVERWGLSLMQIPGVVVVRTRHVCGAAVVGQMPWQSRPVMTVMFVFSDVVAPFQVLAVYRQFVKHARQIGASAVYFDGEETGVDLSAIARRLGATPLSQTKYQVGIP